MKVQDKVVIITGASGGIGLATARVLSSRGAKIILAARSEETLKELEKELPNSLAIRTDMHIPSDIRGLVDRTKEKFGHIDILINNAGQGLRATVEDTDIEDYKSIMDLNVFSVLRAMQMVIPIMRDQGGGLILNVSSMVSKNYYPHLAAYASTKYALNALSLTARQELEKDNIIVSVFHPKMTATDFGQNVRGEVYISSAGRPGMEADSADAVANAIAQQIESESAEEHM